MMIILTTSPTTELRSNGGSDTRLDTLFLKKNARSSSWTDCVQDDHHDQDFADEDVVLHGDVRHGLLDTSNSFLYKSALSAYSELLYNWGYLNQRTEVAKHNSAPTMDDSRVGSLCGECGELLTGAHCDTCR